MDLSIIIVNWNSKDYLQNCLESIRRNTTGLEYEVVVIDSASFDGCAKLLKDHYPEVHFIQSEENLGFAMSNNVAFKESMGRCVLFLNPDTELEGSAINHLYDVLISLPDAGAVGARLLNTDGTIQTSAVQAFPSILNQILNTSFLRKRFPRSRLWGMQTLFSDSGEPSEIDVISGACIMLRRSLFDKVGGFNSNYFMYSEDVDLCLKSRQSGHLNYFVPAATIVHHGGASSDQNKVSNFSSVMLLESRWKYFSTTRPQFYKYLYRASIFAISIVRILFSLGSALIDAVTSRGGNWSFSLKKWYARLRWSIGLEKWAKEYRS